jgi:ADP-heptose:LPS heptosyltransferase
VAAALKRNVPNAEITWLVEPASAPLLIDNPAVDRTIILPKRQWASSLSQPGQWHSTITGIGAFVSELRAAKFDLVLELQGLFKSAIWAGLSAAPIRVGFAHTREGAPLFLTNRLDIGDYFRPDRHIVDLNLSAVDHALKVIGIAGGGVPSAESGLGPVEFPLPPPAKESVQRVEQWLGSVSLAGDDQYVGMVRNVVLIPGTTWLSKIWDWQNWAILAGLLAGQYSPRICLVGGASEESANAGIVDWIERENPEAGILNLTGRTNLLDLVALFQRSDLVVGGDTGPLHLAAATGKPKVLGVYGSTPVGRNGPYGAQCQTVSAGLWCQPCFEKICPLSTTACLKDLTPQVVLDGVRRLLGT